jgi:hypothetical protein
VLDAIIQRRQQKEMARMQQEAQAEQRRLDRQHEQGHWQMQDARMREEAAAGRTERQSERTAKSRAELAAALAEDYQKNQGRNASIIAQGYGGRMEDVTEEVPQAADSPDFGNESMDMRQTRPTGRVRVAGLGDPLEFAPPKPEDSAAYFTALERQIASMPPSPMREIELRRVREAKALNLSSKDTAGVLEQERDRAAQDRRARIAAAAASRRENDKADDLALLNRAGEVVGQARTPQEALKTRAARPTLVAAGKAGEELKQHIDQYGNISRFNPADWLSGDVEQQGVRDQIIDRLIGARKEITGSVTGEDIARYKKQLDTASSRGPEAVKAAVDSFVRELDNMYSAQVESVSRGPARASDAGGDRLEAWKRKAGKK